MGELGTITHGSLIGWKGRFGYHESEVIWGAVSLCVMWRFWRERYNNTVYGVELNRNLLKFISMILMAGCVIVGIHCDLFFGFLGFY